MSEASCMRVVVRPSSPDASERNRCPLAAAPDRFCCSSEQSADPRDTKAPTAEAPPLTASSLLPVFEVRP